MTEKLTADQRLNELVQSEWLTDDQISAEVIAATWAIFDVNPESETALEAFYERAGDTCELAGLPRNHFFRNGHGTIRPPVDDDR